jgi:hypothetical protein
LSLDHRATERGGQHLLAPGSTSGSILTWTCPIN